MPKLIIFFTSACKLSGRLQKRQPHGPLPDSSTRSLKHGKCANRFLTCSEYRQDLTRLVLDGFSLRSRRCKMTSREGLVKGFAGLFLVYYAAIGAAPAGAAVLSLQVNDVIQPIVAEYVVAGIA